MKALPLISITHSRETQTKIRKHKHHTTTRWFTPGIHYHHTITIIASTGRWYTIHSSRSPTWSRMSFSELSTWAFLYEVPRSLHYCPSSWNQKSHQLALNHINKDGCWQGSLKGDTSALRTGKLNFTEHLPFGAKYSLLVQTDSKKFNWLSSYPLINQISVRNLSTGSKQRMKKMMYFETRF